MAKRVLFVTDSLGLGGRENQMYLLASSLPVDWEVLVWSLHDGYYHKLLRNSGVNCIVFDSKKNFVKSFKFWLQKFDPDIVHYWGTSIFLATYFIVLRYQIPCINGSVRIGVLPPQLSHKIKILFASRLCPFVIANSFAGLRATRVPTKRGYVVYNGIDITRFSAKKHNEGTLPLRVVMCANMHSSKKHILLAKVAEKSVKAFGKNRLVFWSIGDERDKSILSTVKVAGSLAIKSSVLQLLGKQTNPISWMNRADIGIHLSNREGLSNSVMEEMASGLPIVASNVGGMNELVTLNSGILDTSNSSSKILELLGQLVNDSDRRKELGVNGRDKIETMFSVKKMCISTIQVYNRAMN